MRNPFTHLDAVAVLAIVAALWAILTTAAVLSLIVAGAR